MPWETKNSLVNDTPSAPLSIAWFVAQTATSKPASAMAFPTPAREGCFLVDDGNVALGNGIFQVMEQKTEGGVAAQGIAVKRLMNQIIAAYGERDIGVFFCKSPGIPFPAVHLSVQIRQKKPVIGFFPDIGRHFRYILSQIRGHPFRFDFPLSVFIQEDMLGPFPFVFVHPKGLLCAVPADFPAKQYQFVLPVVVYVEGQDVLDFYAFGGSPNERAVVEDTDGFVA